MIKKNIPRLLINKDLKLNARIAINNSDQHYLKKVLRLTRGNRVNVFNGIDGEWESYIDNSAEYNLVCIKKIRNQIECNGPSLYFALIKNYNLRWMIEKVTELGVKKLIPIITERTNNNNFNEKKTWLHIKEACEVSERITVPTIEKKSTLINILEHTKEISDSLIFCNETRRDDFLLDYLKVNKNKNISFLVGPEGGFSPDEEKLIKSYKHVISVKLLDRILRAETAAVMAFSIYRSYRDI